MPLRSGENLNAHTENVHFESSAGVRRRELTFDGIKAHALVRLGFPVTEVEIENLQLGVLFERVLDEYNKWLPIQKTDVLATVSSGIQKYDLRALKQPYGRQIVDVQILQREAFFSPISGVFALGIPHPISHLSPDQYDLALRYINLARKIYSSEPDWEFQEPILWLFAPTGFGGPFSAAYTYTQDASQAKDIPQEDHNLVKDYFYYLVMQTVGMSRGKFSGIPGPAAQQLLGTDLVTMGQEGLAKTEERFESKSYARTPPLGWGGKF